MTVPRTGRITDIRGAARNIQELERGLEAQSVQQRAAYRVVSISDTLEQNDVVLLADAAAGMVTVFLPPAGEVETQIFHIVKMDSSANVVRLDADGTELISGAATLDATVQWQTWTIMSVGDAWIVL